ncbi:hypothetical protein EVAR_100902_1 [Eumeta japonica]|uniref:Uncharacterized protein n=1 Tax=Eumeta variegata TaxID=151549 RepID=A0A4C1SUL4_EUMVA|nr:hypothetical protein EVAR_100902_1 [Eumeta japonica]
MRQQYFNRRATTPSTTRVEPPIRTSLTARGRAARRAATAQNNLGECSSAIGEPKSHNKRNIEQLKKQYYVAYACTIIQKVHRWRPSTAQVYSQNTILPLSRPNAALFSFGSQECPVYISLLHNYGPYENVAEFGTQATGFINKCLQIHVQRQKYMEYFQHPSDTKNISVKYESMNLHSLQEYFPLKQCISPQVFLRSTKSGAEEKVRKELTFNETGDYIDSLTLLEGNPPEITVANVCCPTKAKSFFSSFFRAAGTQADDCSPCCKRKTSIAGAANVSEDASCPNMLGTVSHIRIGPPPPCSVHGASCIGSCNFKGVKILPNEERARIKVSTVSNSRRGVFELAVRKLTGAPLAKNELLLEWTPPSSCSPPCAPPCSGPGAPCCSTVTCSPLKCKMIVCKPNSCKPHRKPPCRQLCHPPPCQLGCRAPCHSKPCLMCKPCIRSDPPPPCRRPPEPCPFKCTRVCSVGRGKLRKKKGAVRIRPHPRHKSPCLNRKPECPAARARSAARLLRPAGRTAPVHGALLRLSTSLLRVQAHISHY